MAAYDPLRTLGGNGRVRMIAQNEGMSSIAAFIAALSMVSPFGSTPIMTGQFRCVYMADWTCSPEPEGICIDSGGPRGERATLAVNLDEGRISLNGLDASLERQNLPNSHYVYWRVGALGLQRIELSSTERGIVATLLNEHLPWRGSRRSEFSCQRTR
jgi:hypothetical protein